MENEVKRERESCSSAHNSTNTKCKLFAAATPIRFANINQNVLFGCPTGSVLGILYILSICGKLSWLSAFRRNTQAHAHTHTQIMQQLRPGISCHLGSGVRTKPFLQGSTCDWHEKHFKLCQHPGPSFLNCDLKSVFDKVSSSNFNKNFTKL